MEYWSNKCQKCGVRVDVPEKIRMQMRHDTPVTCDACMAEFIAQCALQDPKQFARRLK